VIWEDETGEEVKEERQSRSEKKRGELHRQSLDPGLGREFLSFGLQFRANDVRPLRLFFFFMFFWSFFKEFDEL